jgi:hypothetical protein
VSLDALSALLALGREIGARESGLAVVTTLRLDGSIHATVVNAGVVQHPVTTEAAIGFVARGGTMKLVHLRARPRATVVFRSGWEWVAVDGDVDLLGPDDILEGLSASDVPALIRVVYAAAAGGSPDDWAPLDDVIAIERHTAVFLRPVRAYTNTTE